MFFKRRPSAAGSKQQEAFQNKLLKNSAEAAATAAAAAIFSHMLCYVNENMICENGFFYQFFLLLNFKAEMFSLFSLLHCIARERRVRHVPNRKCTNRWT